MCHTSTFIVSLLLLPAIAPAQSDTSYIRVPAGRYTVGQRDHPLNPLRTVEVDSFELAATELTNASFERFVAATGYVTDAERLGNALVFIPGLDEFRWLEDSTANWRYPNGRRRGGIAGKENHPVTTISFRDALAYCRWAGVRLPSLDEWEVASRAGAATTYYWGEEKALLSKHGNIWQGRDHRKADSADGYMYTAPVARFAPNTWGFYDMYGNVFEFCTGSLPGDPPGGRVVHARGGSWWCSKNACSFFNSVDIGRVSPRASFSNQGFRVVRVR